MVLLCSVLAILGNTSRFRQAADRFLLGLGVNQIITGVAMTCLLYAKFGIFPRDQHAVLAHRLGLLAYSSYIRDPGILSNTETHSRALRLRKIFATVYALLGMPLMTGFAALTFTGRGARWLEDYMTIIISSCHVVGCMLEYHVDWRLYCPCSDKQAHESELCSAQTGAVGLRLVRWMTGLASFALSLRYIILAKWRGGIGGCVFDSPAETEWTFGQILALSMLMTNIASAFDAFRGIGPFLPRADRLADFNSEKEQ